MRVLPAVRQCFALILPAILLYPAGMAYAQLACNQCHGSDGPPDCRPVDAAFRDVTSGGFKGNHRTHMDATATPASCARCHPGSSGYSSSHRDGAIKLSANINNSPLTARYRNSSSAFPQTATPDPGTCTNINCHFERETRSWGSTPLTQPEGCQECHGAPPLGGAGGAAGSHNSHNNYYGGTGKCSLCHADHLADAKPFAHATSAGRRNLVVVPRDPQGVPGGSYSGPLDDYLPTSQTNQFGSCSNVYCHSTVQSGSDGTGPPVYGTPVWGVATACKGCHAEITEHGGVAADGERWIATGSHRTHNAYRFDTYGTTMIKCTMCHSWTLGPLGGGCGGRCHTDNEKLFANHVNGKVDIAFKPEFTTGSYNGSGIPRSGFSSCSNTYCHSNGTSVATGTIPANTSPRWGLPTLACDSCHGYPPAYANGSPKANSHGRHAYGCNVCHSSVTNNGTAITAPNGYYGIEYHVDKAYTVIAGSGVSFTYLYAAGGGTCSAISCHNNGNATWGVPIACGGCHALPPPTGAHLAHTDGGGALYGSDANGSTATTYRFNCGNCHPVDGSRHGNGTVEVELYSAYAAGLKRHNPPTATRTGSGSATVCLDIYCHSSGQEALVRSYAPTPAWGGTFAGNRCAGCHGDPPTYPSGGAGTPDANSHYTATIPPGESSPVEGGHLVGIHFDTIRSGGDGLIPQGDVPGSGAAHGDPATSTTISCPTCHAATVATASRQSAPGTVFSCTACHLSPPTATIADKSRHVNGTRDVAFMTGTLEVKAQLKFASFTGMVKPLGAVRNSFKTYSAHDSIPFSGSYNQAAKSCTTVCHLNQAVRWGDTQVTCISCHTDLRGGRP